MGCRDRESNFNNLHFDNGKWWATWGFEGTVEAPEREILEAKLNQIGGAWAVTMTEEGSFSAKKVTIPGTERGIFYSSDCPALTP